MWSGDDSVAVEDIDPCPGCGSLELFWNFNGQQHCQRCESMGRSRTLAAKAARFRRRAKRDEEAK